MMGWLRAGPVVLWIGVPLTVGGCGGGETGSSGEAPAPPPAATTPEEAPAEGAAPASSPLMDPTSPEMNETAPETFRARFTTSKGDFVIEAHRAWSPEGVDRFYNLVRHGFYDGQRFFRVLEGFVAQWGIHGDPAIQARWRNANIPDEPVVESNTRGRVSYAKGGPDTRSTQLFINYADNSNLDGMGFPPIGEVVEGMDVVESLYAGHGDAPPRGTGPEQDQIQARGNAYLVEDFADLDHIERAVIVDRP